MTTLYSETHENGVKKLSCEKTKKGSDDDINLVVNKGKFGKKLWVELKKTWHIALPAILTAVTQFSMDFVTASFVGHLGDTEFAAVSEVQNVVDGFVYGIMLGMGSALETLCGQAVGAEEFGMLGIYLQRSWIITGFSALLLTPIYIFTSPLLILLQQDHDIAHMAGKYALWTLPQLFSYAMNFPIQKFLLSQSKVWVMTVLSVCALGLHVLLSWVFLDVLNKGLVGAAIAGNISWWCLIVAQVFYVVSGRFKGSSWNGFSWLAFKNLKGFVKLSLASAVMLCLEVWYFTAVILMVGGLKDATNSIDAVSICLLLQLWTLMVALGFNASVSVRVSNELGAGNSNGAKFSVVVNVAMSAVIGVVFAIVIVFTRNKFPILFSDGPQVSRMASDLAYLLAATILLNSIQPVFHGVAVGAGWQFSVAMLNLVCYYIIGLPMGAVLGYVLKLGVKGIWWGMLGGSLLQTLVLLVIIMRTNWQNEAIQAEGRVKEWGGQAEPQQQQQQPPSL